MRLLLVLLLVFTAFWCIVPTASASACSADATPDGNGVGATCAVPGTGYTCTVRVGADGAPVGCNPPLVVCIRDPCP